MFGLKITFFAYLDSPRPVTASAKLIASPFENGDEVDESGNKIFNTQYMTNSTLVSPVKMEYG